MIRVTDLHKRFESPRALHVLRGVDLSVDKGEFLGIVGASGVGKSTLLHILGALDRPSSGRVEFDGLDLGRLSESDLAEFRNRTVGFVFQFHHLLPEFTALENAQMPALIRGMAPSKAAELARGLLNDVGLAERLDHKPGELSGGEQQRVAIARALLLNPRVVLADEPTGNLDSQTSDEVFRLMRSLNQSRGITFILVTHNEKLSSQADRVVRMVDGRIEPT